MPDEKKDARTNYSSDNKKKKKGKKSKVDIPTIIFFSLLIVGAIVLTVMLLKKPNSKLYSKSYGDNIEILVEVYNNGEVDMAVSVDGERTLQQGKYKAIGEEPKDTYNGEYEVTFKEKNQEVKVNMVIKDSVLTLTYEDNTSIEFKERK